MIGIPFNSGMPARFHLSVTNLAHSLTSNGWPVDINYAEGTYLSTQRNNLSKQAMEEGYDLLFIDSDMVFSPNDVLRIMKIEGDVIGGLYFARRWPYRPLVFKEDLTDEIGKFRGYAVGDVPSKPFRCAGLATGMMYIRNSALKKAWDYKTHGYGKPFNFWEDSSGDQIKEDLAFCHRCNLLGLQMVCVPDVDLGHISTQIITRQEHLMAIQRDYHYCNDLEGWMNVRELNWLHDRAKEMNSIVELGSWKGKSTHALCCGCPGTVTAVDHFKGSEQEREGAHKEAGEKDIYQIFKDNTACFKNLAVLRMESLKVAEEWDNSDMVFIDSGHTYEEVKADIKAWLPKTKKLICGHDYTNFIGVQQAVNEIFGLDGIQVFESIWFKEINGRVAEEKKGMSCVAKGEEE